MPAVEDSLGKGRVYSAVVFFSAAAAGVGVVPGLRVGKVNLAQNSQCNHLSLCLGSTALTSGTCSSSSSVSRGVEASTRENIY